MDRISKEHKILCNGGKKDIGKYRAALSNVFEALNEEEVKRLEELADKPANSLTVYFRVLSHSVQRGQTVT